MKQIYTPEETKKFLLNGMKVVHDIAVDTMGPHGKLIMISEEGQISFSKDGARVTSSLSNITALNDIEKSGASLMIEASKRMSEVSGDGSTTVVKISYEICKMCVSLLTSFKPREIQNSLIKFRDDSLNALDKIKKFITMNDIKKVASISSNNNEEIGELVHELINTLGEQGVFLVEQSYDNKNRTEIKKGFSLDNGAASEYFFHKLRQDNSMKIIMDNTSILLLKGSLTNISLYLPLLEATCKSQSNLLIVADDFLPEVIHSIAANVNRGILKCILVKTPGYGSDKENILNDLSLFCSAKILSEPEITSGLLVIDDTCLGHANKITVTPKYTVISEGRHNANDLASRIQYLKDQQNSTSYEKETIAKRIARLSCGIGTLYASNKFTKELIEDAIQASIKSLREGVVSGCGVDFLEIKSIIEQSSHDSIFKSLALVWESVSKQVLNNAQLPTDVLILETIKSNYTKVPNALTGEMVSKDDIINPYVTTREAIKIAIDTAIKFVLTSYGVSYSSEEKNKKE